MRQTRYFFALLLLLVVTIWCFDDVNASTTTVNITTITEDGDCVAGGKSTGNADLRINNVPRHAYAEYNISTLPSNAVIDSMTLTYKTTADAGDNLMDLKILSVQPSVVAAADLFNNIVAQPKALQNLTYAANTWYTITIPSSGYSGYNLSLGYYALSWFWDGGNTKGVKAFESGSGSYLTITYHLSTDTGPYVFNGPYYENGTRAVAQTITVAVAGGSDSFTLNGSTTEYYDQRPTYVSWEISSGIFRRIYINSDAENITIFNPEDTFTTFGFTIKDFTGETSINNILFATRRIINGTEYTIERVPIENTINNIPVTLVINRNYAIVLYIGTTQQQRNTFYSSTVDTSPTIVYNTISFNRQIQLSSKWIFVDADRPTATSLRVNYTNTRADTNSVVVRIRHMNGTLVNSTTFLVDTFTYTYSPVNNETAYYFDLTINTDWIITPWRKTLPWDPNFNAVPDLSVLGTIGELNLQYGLGLIFIIGVALLFSAKDISIACFSITITTGIAAYFGFFPLNAGAIGLMVLISIGGAIALRGQ